MMSCELAGVSGELIDRHVTPEIQNMVRGILGGLGVVPPQNGQ